jgi:type I restriction enzyme, S subunit
MFIGMEQVEAQTMRLLGTVPAGSMKSGANTFQPLDVLYGRMRSYLNKVYQPDFSGLCSGEFIVFPETRAVLGRFLKYRLNSGDFVRFASRINTGDRPRVDFDQIKVFNVLLPPKPEQDRIADVLDELLSDLEASVATLERVRSKLKIYRASVLKAAVEGALTAEKTPFDRVPLRTLIEGLGQGWSPKCDLTREARDDEWAIIKTTAVQSMKYLDYESKPLPSGLKPRSGIEIKPGDMLMTRKGPRQRAGVACLVRTTRARLMICDTVYRFRCKVDRVEPAYLELALNSPRIVAEIDRKKSGISDSGVSLTHTKLGDIIIPLPSLSTQQAIVESVEDQISVIEHLETDLEAKQKSSQALRQSILRHAFMGQLVPQDPKDEPAAELLKRISAEKEELARRALVGKKTNPKAHKRPEENLIERLS